MNRSLKLLIPVACLFSASSAFYASSATAVQLISDDREVRVFALICDLDCTTVGGLETPSAPFATFDAFVPGQQYSASQHSEVSADLILGQGAAAGYIDGFARSTLDIVFEVLAPTAIVFDGTLTAMGDDFGGDGTGYARLDAVGGANVFLESACGFCNVEDVIVAHVETVLAPGTYALSARASVDEFGLAGSYDFSLTFVPEPSSGVLLGLALFVALRARRRA